MALTRREFLRTSGCALGAGAMTLAFERFGLVNAFAQANEYKALVCVFLNGGNDSDNIVIPYDNYAEYAAVRDSGANVQIPQDSLLTINAPRVGAQMGLHPSLTGLHELYGQGKVAVVCNVGPLVEPTTRDTFRNGTARRPLNLFSHSDQQIQWQTSVAGAVSQTGWGGRVADRMAILNPPGGFPITVSVAGITIFSRGRTTQPLGLAPGVSLTLEGFPTPPDGHPRYEALRQLLGVETVATLQAATNEITLTAVNNSQVLANLPDVTTPFPNTNLGNQLRQAARLIKLNQTAPLGLQRQLFFCSLGGFDLHNNEVVAGNPTTGNHANLWTQVSNAMRAFYDATIELGVENNVTSFTLSDFGRTFKPNNTVGTDHGWGAHHFVMGGSVVGGDLYGDETLSPNGTVFPPLVLGDGVDTDAGTGPRGRWVPFVAVDRYAATLASWYGVAPADIPAIFPNSADGRFDPLDLGFLSSGSGLASGRRRV